MRSGRVRRTWQHAVAARLPPPHGTLFSVNVSALTGNGGLILNGAALPFVVLSAATG